MSTKNRQIVYLLSEADNLTADDLGGKGFGLSKMMKANYPVPPGLDILTGVSRAYAQEGRLPSRLFPQLKREMTRLETLTDKTYGRGQKPLLVSVRSGAPVSMPGMMDTFLNVGLTPTTIEQFAHEIGNKHLALELFKRLLVQFGTGLTQIPKDKIIRKVTGWDYFGWNTRNLEKSSKRMITKVFAGCPEFILTFSDPWEQLEAAITLIYKSWNSERAQAYRQQMNISKRLGTAAVIQTMVFGNIGTNSGTGVVFSRNVATGESNLYGEYLPIAQGEDLVAGIRTPLSISALETENPCLYIKLHHYVKRLEREYKDVVDVEFTVERGRLYLLQVRKAKRTHEAEIRFAVDMVREGLKTEQQVTREIPVSRLDLIRQPHIDPEALRTVPKNRILGTGLPASPGGAVGIAVFDPLEAHKLTNKGDDVILVRQETSPDDFVGMLAAKGIVTGEGGLTCHAAVVAREICRPAIVGVKNLKCGSGEASFGNHAIKQGTKISIDGRSGAVVLGELPLIEPPDFEAIKLISRWHSANKGYKKINFKLRENTWSANTLLCDFHALEALRHVNDPKAARVIDKTYQQMVTKTAEIFAVYLFIAIAGEVRHAKGYSNRRIERTIKLIDRYNVNWCVYDRTDSQEKVIKKVEKMTACQQYRFVMLAHHIFKEGSWSQSFGGESWRQIAEVLSLYLKGSIQPTLFVDRVFDLRHNNGTVFDKHKMICANTSSDFLSKQLTVRRRAKDLESMFNYFARIDYSLKMSPAVQQIYDKYGKLLLTGGVS